MITKPSEAKNLTDYFLSIADIEKVSKYEDYEIEPQFDPLDRKLLKVVDWELVHEIEIPMGDESWREFITQNIDNKNLTKFLNFYIYFNIEEITQSCKELVDDPHLLREEFHFFDLLCQYKFLDKRLKKVISPLLAELEIPRSMFYNEIYG